jgi:hypothetical protein
VAPQASEFLYGIGRLLDEPNADSSCMPTYLLSAFARESVTVALSGDGGDEMFGGYGRYHHTVDRGGEYYSNRILVSTEEHIAELFGGVPAGAREHLRRLREAVRHPATELLCRLRKTDVDNYLPGAVLAKVDRMSMRHSLEVRTPFLNVELARFVERLPPNVLYANKRGKRILRELAYRYLPRELVDLPKQGFALPMTRWARDELLEVAARLLENDESRLRQSFGAQAIARFMQRQRSGAGFSTYQVWALAMLESWLRHRKARLPSFRVEASAKRPRFLPVLLVSAYLFLVGLWLLAKREIAAPGFKRMLRASFGKRYSGELAGFRPDSGHCWLASVPDGLLSDREAASSIMLYEDGTALGPAHSAHADIRSAGEGRFSHWGATLYFSTSDNSDPRTNGRRYFVAEER